MSVVDNIVFEIQYDLESDDGSESELEWHIDRELFDLYRTCLKLPLDKADKAARWRANSGNLLQHWK